MALLSPPDPSQPPSASPLPATYRNPWLNLGDSLLAVVADTRLRAQELWRRNGQGTLWTPNWWSADLAPWFWPLLFSLLLAVSLGGGIALFTNARTELTSPIVPPDTPITAEPESSLPIDAEANPDVVIDQEVDASAITEQPIGPLTALLHRPGADGLLVAAMELPDPVTLILELDPRFKQLSSAEQRRDADLWQQWAQDLGYEHLELRDSRSGLLARDALVGSGMIVISEQTRP